MISCARNSAAIGGCQRCDSFGPGMGITGDPCTQRVRPWRPLIAVISVAMFARAGEVEFRC
jgi:hypothetical protein